MTSSAGRSEPVRSCATVARSRTSTVLSATRSRHVLATRPWRCEGNGRGGRRSASLPGFAVYRRGMTSHAQGHGHRHDHGADFDWEAMADKLEVDGTFVLPLVETVVAGLPAAGLDTSAVVHVVDVGCGPGVVTCALAKHLPGAAVTGLDSASELLARLRARAAEAGLDRRVDAVEADLEHDLPPLRPADLVWASMVVHHVADPPGTLRRLGDLLRPG